jgi:hypothetical protein
MSGTSAWPSDPKRRRELEEALDNGGLEELPPNVPPGFLGETPPDFRKADGDGPHGLNAGITDEWTWETTMLLVALAYIVFFPAAFVILWRSRRVPRAQKVGVSIAMAIGVALTVWAIIRWT